MQNERSKLQDYIDSKQEKLDIEMTEDERSYLKRGYANMSDLAGNDEQCQHLCNNIIIHHFHLIYPDFTLTDNQILSFIRAL